MTRNEAEIILRERFGIEKFYDKQWEAIEKIFNGERVLLIEKTGFGKSLCFQFPATVFEGTTVIFSPLIALMRDQIKKLNSLSISAKCINSGQTPEINSKIIDEAKSGKIKILYIAPERQENEEWIEAVRYMNLSMVVIDEAHCVSVWGHDFRPAFRRIINLVRLLPAGLPVLATTATATKKVESDIEKQIGKNVTVIRGNLLRENFQLHAIKVNSEDEKMIWLGKNTEALSDKLNGTGIIYSGTRADTEIYSRWFEYLNISSVHYNAGLDTDSRIEIENGLISNKWKCVISTNALGMGIDKPDIRFIIHTQIPQSPVHYYQEIGRAGRDNKPTIIILFYKTDDRKLPEAFIEGGRPAISKYNEFIDAVKNELLGERELIKQTNLKQTQVRVIKADLMEQGIIRQVILNGRKKFEYVTNAPALNSKSFEELRAVKMNDLKSMIEYVETKQSRMKYLCDFLGDKSDRNYQNCDNTGLKKLKVIMTPEWQQKLNDFREGYFPLLDVQTKGSNLLNGIASSFYGFSNTGDIIHKCKYETKEDFPDFLLRQTVKAFQKKFSGEKIDMIVHVPPTDSGDLLKNFAMKVSEKFNIPVSHGLEKSRITKAQKLFESGFMKRENVSGAFVYKNGKEIYGKNILLIDDIFDSGATIKEIGKYLTKCGAGKIIPLVIAKTIGGDLA
jgi:ATP-dependent DNA helicase RecQ